MTSIRRGLLLRGRRRDARWWMGVGLVTYGVAGLVILGIAAIGLARPVEQLGTLGATVETQRGSLVNALRDTSRTLSDAGSGFTGFEESIAQARRSSDRAAALARDASGTMSGVAREMSVTVFGVQPFAQLAPQFERVAEQLTQLGSDLDAIGTAMSRNASDLSVTRQSLDRVRARVDDLAAAAETTPVPAGTAQDFLALRLALYALLLWLALIALASIVLGVVLWRRAEET